MADTAAGRRLSSGHRRRQVQVRNAALADVTALFRTFDPEDIVGSYTRLQRPVETVLLDHHAQSAAATQVYLAGLREAEQVPGRAPVARRATPDRERLRRDVTWTLRAAPFDLLRRNQAGRVREVTGTLLAGMSTKTVLEGGRQTMVDAVMEDEQAVGWVRVTNSANPCAFCRMLAGRGAVYKSGQSALRVGRRAAPDGDPYTQQDGWARVRGTRQRDDSFHAGCMCTTEPQYTVSGPWQRQFPDNVEHRRLYDRAAAEAREAGDRGKNPELNAMRRIIARQG